MNVLAQLRERFEAALAPFTDDPIQFAGLVRPSQDVRFGDYQANCAMPLAKPRGENPRELAAKIVERLDIADLCEPPEIAGPGFINLRLRDDWLQQQTQMLAADERLGVPHVAAPQTVVVDYSAPNVAKPMHVGHLRSTVIGAALCQIHSFLGHKVVSDNHIGDWGTQFGMIIYGYKNFLDEDAYRREPVTELARQYRLVNQLSDYHDALAELPRLETILAEKQGQLEQAQTASQNDKAAGKTLKKLRTDIGELQEKIAGLKKKIDAVESSPQLKPLAEAHPDIAAASRRETARLHAGDAENLGLWERFLPQCLDAIGDMYDRLGIRFDLTLGESFYQPMLADVVADLKSKNLAQESEGAVCVFIEGNDAPFIVRKSDGAYTYATTDLATIKYRAETLEADVILYVVDARQSEHFQLLFETARRWGYDRLDFRHISFGTILGDDRKPFKTRSGDTVGLESLLDEAVARARKIVDENDDSKKDGPELDDATRAAVAEAVGIGGIKYADLNHNRDSDYVFNWDKMLAKNGDTATYMQYAYARISGIFRKGQIDRDALRQSAGRLYLAQPEERRLALQLNRFAETLEAAAGECRPNLVTQYLFETANVFSSFYDLYHVLSEEDESIRTSRLLLCDLTARVLSQGLSLLGISACERM
jgi:arginyl-tRNA synthetase